jgi:PAS domain S-box-containing protein
MPTQISREILSLQSGDHLCLFYEKDPAEQMPALIPFIQEGLSGDERFIYIADDQTVAQLTERLEQSGIPVEHETGKGRLNLWTRAEWRQPGLLSSESKARQVQKLIDESEARGFKGVRFAVEMTWTLGPDIEAHQLEHWEATINTLFLGPGFPGRIICQYNRSRLTPEAMLAALHTHPLAILGEHVCPNLFYEAPLILDSHSHGRGNIDGNGNGHDISIPMKVDWMLTQLRRARIAEIQRQESAEYKRAENANQWLAAIVESADDAIISKDLDGLITSWNNSAERIFGYTAEEAIGQPVTMLIPADRPDEEPEILALTRQGERIDHYETLRRRKDGSLVEISLKVSPIRDAYGKVMGASKVARDITGYKQTELALKLANEQLANVNEELERRVQERTASLQTAIEQMEEFSYSVSHDLRAPARAMQGYARVLLDDYGDRLDETGKDFLERIIRGGTRMDRLIQDILTYSRLSRREVELQTVSLDKLVREIVQQYPEMLAGGATMVIQEQLLSVIGHEPSLAQAISNLLNNAVKFVAPGTAPYVRIRTEQRGDHVCLWISDNGIGIKPEYQSRLFGMFERVHPEQRYEGTGIGLAIVRKAVERMGGKVGVESDGLTGSSFWIQLPAATDR